MESESKLTFGNILVGLLLLGVVVVIGLIVFVYFALTKPETRKTTAADDTPAAQQIDRLSPDGRTLPSVPRSEASKVATPANNKTQQAEADKIANEMRKTNETAITNVDSSMANKAALGTGEVVKPKQPKRTTTAPKTPKRTQTADSEKTTSERNTAANGERELKPTNERPLQPINIKRRADTTEGERKLEPTNKRETAPARETTRRETPRRETPANNSNSGGERKLEPVKKAPARSNEGFDNLF